jgi:hypothetical protein
MKGEEDESFNTDINRQLLKEVETGHWALSIANYFAYMTVKQFDQFSLIEGEGFRYCIHTMESICEISSSLT